jgi:hypothetical protein
MDREISNTSKINYLRADNKVFEEFRDYVTTSLSKSRSRWVGSIISKYMHAAIDSALHGNTVNIKRGTELRFVRIATSVSHKYHGYKFKSLLTSDYIFMIHITGPLMSKFRYRYYPNKALKKQVQDFIDSSNVYNIIRTNKR